MNSQARSGAPVAPFDRATWRVRKLTVPDGFEVAVYEAGRSERSAPALVLVHGMGHDVEAAWGRVAARFVTTHRIVAFDLPGFGASDEPDVAYTLAFFTTVLDAVVRDRDLESFALAGHSLGGVIAANYASRNVDLIRALVLIAPAGFVRTPVLALRVLASGPVLRLLRTIRPSRAFVSRTLDRAVYDPASIDAADRERILSRSLDPATARAFVAVYAGALNELIHMRSLHARFRAWQKPTTIVWGREDRFIAASGLAAARAVFPHAHTLTIERCGHCPHVEVPDTVVARMRSIGV
jgi:pimeloyl-ACP methyl ester carboxylesterase